MNKIRTLIALFCVSLTLSVLGQETRWAAAGTLAQPPNTGNFFSLRPPLIMNPANGRLLVQTEGITLGDVTLGDVSLTWYNTNKAGVYPNAAASLTPTALLTNFFSMLASGVYQVSPPTKTDGQIGPLQTDASGNLKVTGPVTDTELRATPLTVSGTVTANDTGTQAILSVETNQLVSLQAQMAIVTNQFNTHLANVSNKLETIDAKLASLSVTNADGKISVEVVATNETQTSVGVTNPTGSTFTVSTRESTNHVGGFTLITSLPLTNYLGENLIAGDALNTNGIEVVNAVRASGGTGVLLCSSYISSTNLALQAVDMIVADRALTWPEASSVANLVQSELPYILGVVQFGTNGTAQGTEWATFGTNQICTVSSKSIGIKPNATSIFLYFKTRAAITNAANDLIKLTISQD